MRRRLICYSMIVALLALGPASLVHAQKGEAGEQDQDTSKGAVFTVTAVDAKKHMATLKGEDGKMYQAEISGRMSQVKVGGKVECDLMTEGTEADNELENCQPWGQER